MDGWLCGGGGGRVGCFRSVRVLRLGWRPWEVEAVELDFYNLKTQTKTYQAYLVMFWWTWI